VVVAKAEYSEQLSVVVMCGGSGTRFWPASRRTTPKQFLRLFSKSSLVQETVARLEGLVPPELIFLLAAREHADLLRRHLPNIPADNYILEPAARNTGPALALAARRLEQFSPSMVIAALPADHSISDNKEFRRCLGLGWAAAKRPGVIATLGIKPDVPETGYGYIELGKEAGNGVKEVKRFVEKPTLKRAQEFLKKGNYLWNSGMFILRADTLTDQMKRHQPQIWKTIWEKVPPPGSPGFDGALAELYPKLAGISIDYAIMERAQGVVCVPATFGWNDLGSWTALEKLWGKDKAGNASNDRYYSIDSSGNVVSRGGGEIALLGVKDLVVVERGGVVLVCAKDRCQDLRKMIELLERDGRNDLL
jgi:mannose-1-phosphate guanylyltransferase